MLGMLAVPRFRSALVAATLLTAAAVAFPHSPALAQGGIGQFRAQAQPQEAQEHLREANRLLETLRTSTLEASWRAQFLARMARSLARSGDASGARTFTDQALLVLGEPVKQKPVPQLAPAVVYAILAQAMAESRDREAAVTLASNALDAVKAIEAPGARATTYALIGQVYLELGDNRAAQQATLEALRNAVAAPAGSERVTALAMAGQTQAKLGDANEARQTISAAHQELRGITDLLPRASAFAYIARAESAGPGSEGARSSIRDALQAYDYTRNDTRLPAFLRITTLSLIAVAQAEFRDRANARQTLRAAVATLEQATQPAERFQALIAIVDAFSVVEKLPN